jgi:hypothetical protein
MAPTDDIKLSKLTARMEFLEDKVMTGIEAVKENQERMCDDISKIKEAVYNPDEGLYARLRAVEDARRTSSKFIWLLLTVTCGALAAAWASTLS